MNSWIWTTYSLGLSEFEFSHYFCRLFPILLNSCWHSLLFCRQPRGSRPLLRSLPPCNIMKGDHNKTSKRGLHSKSEIYIATDYVFFHRFMVRALRAWVILQWVKNSVRNLQYDPRTRLLRLGLHERRFFRIRKYFRAHQLEYSDWLAFTLKGYSDSWPFINGHNSENIHDEMVIKLFVASTSWNKMRPKKASGRLRQSEVFFPFAHHAIVVNHVVQSGICPVLIQNRFSIVSSSSPIKSVRKSTLSVSIISVCKKYSFTHYKILPGPVAQCSNQRPPLMTTDVTTTVTSLDPPDGHKGVAD